MGEVNSPGIGQFLSVMDKAQGPRAHLGNPLGFGRMDHGASMEIGPIDFILFAMFIALAAMWMDQ